MIRVCLIIATALCLAITDNKDNFSKVYRILSLLAIILMSISFLGK